MIPEMIPDPLLHCRLVLRKGRASLFQAFCEQFYQRRTLLHIAYGLANNTHKVLSLSLHK